MKIGLNALLHFDGTTMAIEVQSLYDAEGTRAFYGDNDEGARVIEFLRAKGLDVHDQRLSQAEQAEPVEPMADDTGAERCGGSVPIYPPDTEFHHVTHSPPKDLFITSAQPELPKPKPTHEEIKL